MFGTAAKQELTLVCMLLTDEVPPQETFIWQKQRQRHTHREKVFLTVGYRQNEEVSLQAQSVGVTLASSFALAPPFSKKARLASSLPDVRRFCYVLHPTDTSRENIKERREKKFHFYVYPPSQDKAQ
eukprot:gene12458-8546_t